MVDTGAPALWNVRLWGRGGSYLGSGRSDSRPAVWQLETWRHTGCTGRGPSERRSPPGAWPLHALKKEPKRLWRRQTRTEMLDKIKKGRKERRNKGGWVCLQAAFCSFDPPDSQRSDVLLKRRNKIGSREQELCLGASVKQTLLLPQVGLWFMFTIWTSWFMSRSYTCN